MSVRCACWTQFLELARAGPEMCFLLSRGQYSGTLPAHNPLLTDLAGVELHMEVAAPHSCLVVGHMEEERLTGQQHSTTQQLGPSSRANGPHSIKYSFKGRQRGAPQQYRHAPAQPH
jgi:hypothetical protein